MKKTISIGLICFFLGMIASFFLKRGQEPQVVTLIDTIRDTTIVPKIVKSERVLTVHDTITQYIINKDTISLTDTVYRDVRIPTFDYTFKNEDAKVVVNGYGVKLNSFESYRKTKIVKTKPKWSIGVGIGYGATNNGLEPVVSISVNRVLFSW